MLVPDMIPRTRISRSSLGTVFDAAEAGVRKAGVGRGFHPRAGAITGAVNIAAEIGAATNDALGCLRLARIEAVAWAFGVELFVRLVGVGTIKVEAPFPDVACHVVESVTVGGKTRDGCGGFEAIDGDVFEREFSLPNVGHLLPARFHRGAPDVRLLAETTARGVFPFRFSGQTFTRPFRVGGGVFP